MKRKPHQLFIYFIGFPPPPCFSVKTSRLRYYGGFTAADRLQINAIRTSTTYIYNCRLELYRRREIRIKKKNHLTIQRSAKLRVFNGFITTMRKRPRTRVSGDVKIKISQRRRQVETKTKKIIIKKTDTLTLFSFTISNKTLIFNRGNAKIIYCKYYRYRNYT